MDHFVALDEIGHFWIVDNDDNVIRGPFNTQEEALAADPDAYPYY